MSGSRHPWFCARCVLPQRRLLEAAIAVGVLAVLAAQSQDRLTAQRFSAGTAERMTDAELLSYARSAVAIERVRQSTYGALKRRVEQVPPIACDQPARWADLQNPVRDIAADYCLQAIEIAEEHHLTIAEFNKITRKLHSSPELADRVQNLLLSLQGGSVAPSLEAQ